MENLQCSGESIAGQGSAGDRTNAARKRGSRKEDHKNEFYLHVKYGEYSITNTDEPEFPPRLGERKNRRSAWDPIRICNLPVRDDVESISIQ